MAVLIKRSQWQERFGAFRPPACACAADEIEISILIMCNGRPQYRPTCPVCNWHDSSPLPHRHLTDDERTNARIIRINRQSEAKPRLPRVEKTRELRRCEQHGCGKTTTDWEIHHWAPRAIFADASWWPTSVLCKSCHQKWHKKINSYFRGKYGAKQPV